jgi:hypothetical protein
VIDAGAGHVIDGVPLFTVKLCSTGAAAVKLALPACVARIVHPPAATIATVEPDTVHTPVVSDVKLAGNPDEADALTANGAAPNVFVARGPNVIDCEILVTSKLCVTGVAAAQFALPACVALIAQLPPATSVTVEPATEHTPGVVDAKLTASPDVADALAANGAVP